MCTRLVSLLFSIDLCELFVFIYMSGGGMTRSLAWYRASGNSHLVYFTHILVMFRSRKRLNKATFHRCVFGDS
jgi:hypothetical protein